MKLINPEKAPTWIALGLYVLRSSVIFKQNGSTTAAYSDKAILIPIPKKDIVRNSLHI